MGYMERAFSHGFSSMDSSQMTHSPEHCRQVIIPYSTTTVKTWIVSGIISEMYLDFV